MGKLHLAKYSINRKYDFMMSDDCEDRQLFARIMDREDLFRLMGVVSLDMICEKCFLTLEEDIIQIWQRIRRNWE